MLGKFLDSNVLRRGYVGVAHAYFLRARTAHRVQELPEVHTLQRRRKLRIQPAQLARREHTCARDDERGRA